MANHQHGTRLAYVVDQCGCAACSAANTAEQAGLRRVKQEARWNAGCPATPSDLVAAGPAREHLYALMAAGMGLKTIAKKGGVARSSITAILYGKQMREDSPESRPPRKRIRRDLECRILAIEVDLADHALVDATGTRRRMQALCAIGWSQAALARRLDLTHGQLNRIVNNHLLTTAHTAASARTLYDELWNTPPPSRDWRQQGVISRMRRAAQAAGWAPPAAWDDETIDDPSAQPAERRKGSDKYRRTAELIEDIEWLVADDATLTAATHRLNVTTDYLLDTLRKASRTDLVDRLWRNERKETVA